MLTDTNLVEWGGGWRWYELKVGKKREVLVSSKSTQPKSSSEFGEFVFKRVFQRYLVISDLKRDELGISLSSRESLFQSRWVL